jgi:hypothetical protein
MIKPLPNGQEKHVTVSMHSYKQTHGTCGVFGGFSKATTESRISDKDVAKF